MIQIKLPNSQSCALRTVATAAGIEVGKLASELFMKMIREKSQQEKAMPVVSSPASTFSARREVVVPHVVTDREPNVAI